MCFAMRGVRVAPIDDAMLLSYTLDAGATGDDHSIDTLSERFLGHKPIALSEVAGSGRNFVGFARVADRKGVRIRERRRPTSPCVSGACCSRASSPSG